jgi:hypothetical protein
MRSIRCRTLLGSFLLFGARLLAADSSGKASLDTYLRQIRYQPIDFKLNEANKPLVQGDLGTGKKLTFVLDTGWSMTTINTRSASGLNNLGDLKVELDDALMGRLNDPSMLLIKTLTLGHSQFLNQPAASQELTFDYMSIPFEGIIGSDFFFRNHCLFDLYARKLYVRGMPRSAEESQAMEETFRKSGFIEIPARLSSHLIGGLRIDCVVNNKPVVLLVDTGCNITVLDESQIDRLALTFVRENRPSTGSLIPQEVSGRGVGVGEIGMHKFRVAKLQSLQLGSAKWQNVNVAIGNLSYWGLSKSGSTPEETHGVFGIDELTKHGVLIDYSSRKLWLRPETSKH